MRDITKERPIGLAYTHPLHMKWNGEEITMPGEVFSVVEVVNHGGEKIYVTNKWYKPGVPQILHERLVLRYAEIPPAK